MYNSLDWLFTCVVNFGGLDLSMISRLKELMVENDRLKKMYADECLKSEILREAIEKKW
jgi:putative transposase